MIHRSIVILAAWACLVIAIPAHTQDEEPVTFERLDNAGSFKRSDGRMYYFVPFERNGAMPLMFAKKMPDLANMYMLAMSEAWGLASLEDVDAVMVMCVQFPEVQKHAACISFWQRDSLKEGEESAGVVLVSEPLPVL